LGDLGIKERIILKWCEDVDWIQLALDRVQWKVVMNMMMNH
jgi:hypothetical protein